MEKVQVVAAIIEKSGKFLLGKRNQYKSSVPGYWCPISGRIEANENETQALVREVFEEIGLIIETIRKICEFDTRDGKGRLHWWQVRIVSGEATLLNDEHTELRWVDIEEMRTLSPVLAEDLAVFEKIATDIRLNKSHSF